jgi:hypothetical protein
MCRLVADLWPQTRLSPDIRNVFATPASAESPQVRDLAIVRLQVPVQIADWIAETQQPKVSPISPNAPAAGIG